MLSSDNWVAVPLYLELAPPADAAAQVAHLFVFRDTGALSGRGSGRFATDLFTLSVTGGDRAQISLAPPRPDFTRRQSSFCGIVAGLRLSARPEHMPEAATLESLALALARVRESDDGLPSLVSALDDVACRLSFAARPKAVSDRTERRRTCLLYTSDAAGTARGPHPAVERSGAGRGLLRSIAYVGGLPGLCRQTAGCAAVSGDPAPFWPFVTRCTPQGSATIAHHG